MLQSNSLLCYDLEARSALRQHLGSGDTLKRSLSLCFIHAPCLVCRAMDKAKPGKVTVTHNEDVWESGFRNLRRLLLLLKEVPFKGCA